MTTKISCGGFDIDNDTLIEEDGVLKVKNGGGGGGGGGALVVKLTTENNRNFTADKTMGEIFEAAKNGSVVFIRDITDPSVPGFVTTQISQIVQVMEYTGQGYGVYVAMPVVNLSQGATSLVVFDLLPMQTTSLDAYPTGEIQEHPST